jgi:hypothetical protein
VSVLGARPHAGRPRRQRRTDADHQEGTSNERVVFAGRAAAVAEVLTGTFRPEGFIGRVVLEVEQRVRHLQVRAEAAGRPLAERARSDGQ